MDIKRPNGSEPNYLGSKESSAEKTSSPKKPSVEGESPKLNLATQSLEPETPISKKRRRWPWLVLVGFVVLAIVAGVGYWFFKTYFSLNKVIQENTGIAAAGLKQAEKN